MTLGRTPEPSKRFHSITLPISELDREWYRSHLTRRGPIYFGRNRAYRFDAPDGEYGVLYVGADPHVAFIESFQIAGIRPAVTQSKLKERSLSLIRIRRPVRLVNLAESGALTRIGADARYSRRATPFPSDGREPYNATLKNRMAFCIGPGTTPLGSPPHFSTGSSQRSFQKPRVSGWIRKPFSDRCWIRTVSPWCPTTSSELRTVKGV